MLLMIDNYDSFTFNLVQYFGELGVEVRVVRNDGNQGVRVVDREKIFFCDRLHVQKAVIVIRACAAAVLALRNEVCAP